MEFTPAARPDVEENPLAEPRRRKRRADEAPTAWQVQAARWRGPEHGFECCGTSYRAMTVAAAALAYRTHLSARHPEQLARPEVGA